MRKGLVSPNLLKQLLVSDTKIKLLYPVLARRAINQQEEEQINKQTLIDQSQEIVNLLDLSEMKQPIPYKLTSEQKFESFMQAKFLKRDQKIIIFDRTIYLSCRLWWILRYHGFTDVNILDGGFSNWKSHQNHNLDNIDDQGILKQFQEQKIVTFEKMCKVDHSLMELIDTRPEEIYSLGCIGKAKNVPWEDILDNRNCFKSDAEIRQLFIERDIDLDKQIVTYCHTGKTATVLNLALDLIGKSSYLYDGSYLEYSTKIIL